MDEFDKILDLFLTDLEKIFGPNDKQLSMYKTLLSGARMFGSHVDLFHSNLEPYKKQIFQKNELFFMSDDKTCIANSLGLSGHWVELSPENKNIIWDYFQTLYYYSCIAKNISVSDLQEYIN